MSLSLIIWSDRACNWSETPVPVSKQSIPIDTCGVKVPPVECNSYVDTWRAYFCSPLALQCLREGNYQNGESYVCWRSDFTPCSFVKGLGGFHCWLETVGRDVYLWYKHETWVLSFSNKTEMIQELFRSLFCCMVCWLVLFLAETWNERIPDIPLFPFSVPCLQLQLDR